MRQLKISKQITNRENQSLEKYLQEINKIELLNPEEEVLLAKSIQNGDKKALEKLTKANLRFVVSVAKQYSNLGLTLNDLINEGNFGLIKAAQKFDESRGFKFISYAVWWIRQSIMQSVAEHSRFVRLPLNRVSSINQIGKTAASLEQIYEREPTSEEIAESLDVSVKEIDNLLRINNKVVSMDQPVNTDQETVLADLLEDKYAISPDQGLFTESIKIEIERILSTLTHREADVLRHYYGLGGYFVLSLDEIAEKFCLTKERVRQIKDKSIQRIRNMARISPLRLYLG